MGLAFYIGVRFPFHLDPLESKNAATLQISGFGGPLKAEKILGEEFKYASKTAEQAMEHRMTIVNYYLLIVGGGGSGVIALINANHALAIAAVPLLWLVSTFGGLSLLLIIALRRAWAGSIMEMNSIKEFFIVNAEEFAKDDLKKAFTWQPETIPDTWKRGSVFHFTAVLIGLLDSVAFFGGIFALGYTSGVTLTTPILVVTGFILAFIFFMAHLWLFDMMLIPVPKKGSSQKETPVGDNDQSMEPQIAPASYTFHPSAQPNTVVRSEQKFSGKLLTLRVEEIRLPDGSTSRREIVEHEPAVVIIPYLDKEDAFLFIEQYRDAVGQTLLELPAGMIAAGEDPMAAAQRELLEETGYTATEMLKLSTYYTSPGFTNEQHHLYLATGLQQRTGIQDTTEIHALHRVSRAGAMAMVEGDAIPDGKTVLGLVWADRRLPRQA